MVYAAPVNEKTQKWGVYAVPRLWRVPDGRLFIRFNGEIDSPDYEKDCCPTLWFLSADEGKTWLPTTEVPDTRVLADHLPPFCRLPDGRSLGFRAGECPDTLAGIPVQKRLPLPNGQVGDEIYTYKQGDLPPHIFAFERVLYAPDGSLLSRVPASLDFPEREILSFGKIGGVETPRRVWEDHYYPPYVFGVCPLSDGTLIGLCWGQAPGVGDRYCGETYLVASIDGGLSWHRRATVTRNAERYPFGLTGDGGECSLALGGDGTLYCVTRTDMSCDHERLGGRTDTMFFRSHDGGYTWDEGKPVADGSVTPHVLTFGTQGVLVIYGRPGVHMILSEDGGDTFGTPVSVIGKTLAEELAAGKSYMDAKYFDTSSYSNTSLEKLSDNRFLLLYNDMRYDTGDGERHKAGLVREITVM